MFLFSRPAAIASAVVALLLLSTACTADNQSTADSPSADASKPQKTESAPPAAKNHPANRLAKESSPYLLLHAHNPVDWYPWGPEAFAAAKKQNKPIFLSIGYSSCYWCHVMERLVFENEDIAKYMNEHFINIKVDREERPDVDDVYMTSLIVYYQLAGSPRGGGWPLSMFLTPEGKPFAGGSYFPPEDTDGRIGFRTVLSKVNDLWQSKQDDLRNNAEAVTSTLQEQLKPRRSLEKVSLDASLIKTTVAAIEETYDSEYGGIGYSADNPNPAKFPSPPKLSLLMDRARNHGDGEARQIVLHTLEQIAMGGIRDHIGGGFHRYSTDRRWHVPHFEKMLYDQAQLVPLFLQAWQLTDRQLYRRAAVETLDYVLAGMTGKEGEFYSALDAETDTVEGKYYVWSKQEITAALGDADAAQFFEVYGLNEPNPFEHGFVLYLPRPLEESAKKLNLSPAELDEKIAGWRQKLKKVRDARPRPLLDDKTLTSWNALMISAFADAGRILKNEKYTAAAVKAASFLLNNVRDKHGDLLHTWRNGQAKLAAYLDDYAFFVAALLDLYDTTHEARWLDAAKQLAEKQNELFWDEKGHAYYFTANGEEPLIARTKNAFDSVLPSGNGIAARNLVRLAGLTGDKQYLDRAAKTIRVFAPVFEQSPRGMAVLTLALSDYLQHTAPNAKRPTSNATQRISRSALAAGSAGSEPRTGAPRLMIPLTHGSNHRLTQTTGTIRSAIAALNVRRFFQTAVQKEDMHKVKIKPLLNVDKLPPGKTCRIVLYVDVKEGWHINQNPPMPDNFIETIFTIKSKEGVKLKNVKYPKGKPFKLEGLDETLMVYEGRVAIYAELEVPAAAAGKTDEISVELTYQACNDKTCLRKQTMTVGGKVQVADSPDDVKPVNQDHFKKK